MREVVVLQGLPPSCCLREWRPCDDDGVRRLVQAGLAEYGFAWIPENEPDLDDIRKRMETARAMYEARGFRRIDRRPESPRCDTTYALSLEHP